MDDLSNVSKPATASESNENDSDLNDLLQSALEDFDKPLHVTVSKNENKPAETSAKDAFKSQSQKTSPQEDFEGKFANLLLHDVDDSTFSTQISSLLNEVKNEIESCSDSLNGAGDDSNIAIDEAVKSLMQNIEKMKNTNSDQLPSLDNMGAAGFPMMDQMFQMFMSKEVLYPSLQSVKEKYPTWLEENKDKIDATELDRYSRQFNVIKQICVLFESEQDSDSENIKQQRFNRLLSLLQEMTDLGQPPSDFAESVLPGYPSPTELLDVNSDPNNCNAM